jgi:hypothetical protein
MSESVQTAVVGVTIPVSKEGLQYSLAALTKNTRSRAAFLWLKFIRNSPIASALAT